MIVASIYSDAGETQPVSDQAQAKPDISTSTNVVVILNIACIPNRLGQTPGIKPVLPLSP